MLILLILLISVLMDNELKNTDMFDALVVVAVVVCVCFFLCCFSLSMVLFCLFFTYSSCLLFSWLGLFGFVHSVCEFHGPFHCDVMFVAIE